MKRRRQGQERVELECRERRGCDGERGQDKKEQEEEEGKNKQKERTRVKTKDDGE